MPNRTNFLRELSRLELNQTEEAIALLWFYRQTQAFEERSASELSADFRDENFTAPNPSRLGNALRRNRRTVAGRRRGTFQVNARYLDELEVAYGNLLTNTPARAASPLVLPEDFGRGTRHLEQLVIEINGTYERGYYDGCAVMLRRILESLIISVFLSRRQADMIRVDGNFLSLEALILKVLTFDQIHLARDARRIMGQIKEVGDVAAHSRNYLTKQQDIDDIKLGARRVLDELLQAIS